LYKASEWDIGDPACASVASLELLKVLGNLDNALPERLRPWSRRNGQMPIDNAGRRSIRRFNDSDYHVWLDTREIIGSHFDFVGADSLCGAHHQFWVSPRHRSLPRTTFEIRHLLLNVRSWKTCKPRVFRTTRSVGSMAAAASEHDWLSSPSHDLRHWRVIARVPIRRKVQVSDLR
jgi:hypothetical protein